MTDRATVRLADGLVVDRLRNELRFAATVCLREGWLEQLVCTPQTREHEAIFVTSVRPSLVHAGLLLLGLEPGTPGSWRLEGERLIEVEPTGPAIEIFVRFHPAAAPGGEPSAGAIEGETAEIPIAALVMDISTDTQLHGPYWRFAGSELLGDDRPPQIPPYAADWSGSLVGLVTFGDEVLALPNVRPDQVDVAPGEWLAWTERIPPLGTAVTIILRPRSAAAD